MTNGLFAHLDSSPTPVFACCGWRHLLSPLTHFPQLLRWRSIIYLSGHNAQYPAPLFFIFPWVLHLDLSHISSELVSQMISRRVPGVKFPSPPMHRQHWLRPPWCLGDPSFPPSHLSEPGFYLCLLEDELQNTNYTIQVSLQMSYILHWKLPLHDIKINGKIHANVLNLIFLL